MGRIPARFRATSLICACLLCMPVLGQAQTGKGAIACGNPYVIGKGDTLSTVARKAYGDHKRSDVLFDVNRGVIGNNPANVALGLSIMVPCLDASGKPVTSAASAKANAAMAAAIATEGPLGADDLDTIFGPIALFPDSLMTQILVAATFPLDVMKADRFVKDSAALSDKDRADAAENQAWDPSVVQLAAGFPDIISKMADHIDWTEQAGEAFVAQTDDVLDSIQRLRAKAQENGYLTENDAQTVEVVDNRIYIAPADPQVIYVPVYDSQVIYTTPISSSAYNPYYYGYPGDDWARAIATGAIIFGTAVILDHIFDNHNNYWGGSWHNNRPINWNNGDININRGGININGDVNIGSGNIKIGGGNNNIGNGNVKIGGGNTSIGNGKTKIGGGNTNIGNGNTGIGNGNRGELPTTLPARIGGSPSDALAGTLDNRFAPDAVSRDAARQKLETRQSISPGASTLPATRPSATIPKPNTAAVNASRQRATAATQPSTKELPTNVTKPKKVQLPSAGARPSNVTAFEQPGGGRASAGAARGRASSAGRRN